MIFPSKKGIDATGKISVTQGEVGLLLAVHHLGWLPLRCPQHRPLRQGVTFLKNGQRAMVQAGSVNEAYTFIHLI